MFMGLFFFFFLGGGGVTLYNQAQVKWTIAVEN